MHVYEACLLALSDRLNALHDVNFSLRYWRIIIGPWLNCFIPSVFDRLTMIKTAQSQHGVGSILLQHGNSPLNVPHDMNEFLKWHHDDPWNERLICRIVELAGLDIAMVPPSGNGRGVVKPVSQSKRHFAISEQTKGALKKCLGVILGCVMKRERVVIIRSGLSFWQYVRLNLRLQQIPSFSYTQAVPLARPEAKDRTWHLSIKVDAAGNVSPQFIKILETLIPEQMPSAYVEGFRANRLEAKKSRLSGRAEVIYSINRWMNDAGFKFWLAEALEKGAKFLLGQHGGFFGVGQWSSFLDHQIEISDRYLTWGWGSSSEKVRSLGLPLSSLKERKAPIQKQGHILMPQMACSRYSTYLSSWPIAAGQWEEYFNEQAMFIDHLPSEISQKLAIRLYPKGDYGLMQRSRWQKRFPHITLDLGNKPMNMQLGASSLLLATYNATTFLEGFIQNIPTMIFWNPDFWELDESAQPFFAILERSGVFHRSAESAAKHLIDIWPDINQWWEHPETQDARRVFCERFAVVPHDLVGAMHREITDVLPCDGNVYSANC